MSSVRKGLFIGGIVVGAWAMARFTQFRETNDWCGVGDKEKALQMEIQQHIDKIKDQTDVKIKTFQKEIEDRVRGIRHKSIDVWNESREKLQNWSKEASENALKWKKELQDYKDMKVKETQEILDKNLPDTKGTKP